jgi:carboxymethylenebutenolidase
MALHVENVTYGNGEHTGYFVLPGRGERPLPAIVVLQEAWGLDAHLEDVARRFAYAGYAVLAPDLYARGGIRPAPLARPRLAELLAFVNEAGPGIFADEKTRGDALSKLPTDVAARVRESMAAMTAALSDLGAHVPALLTATRHLREERAETRGQRIGSVGYCLGGGLSALLACHDPQLAAACVYYGRSPAAELVAHVHCPVFGFYGGEDKRVNEGVPAFAEAMKKARKYFESHVYAGAMHAFFNDERPTYHAGAARDAFARTLEVFRTHLAQAH